MATPTQTLDLTNLLLFLRTIQANNVLAHQHLQQATEQVSRVLAGPIVDMIHAQGQADLAFTYIKNAHELAMLNQYNLAEYLQFFQISYPTIHDPPTPPMNRRWTCIPHFGQPPRIILEDPNDPTTTPPATYYDIIRTRAREHSHLLGMINANGTPRYPPQPTPPRITHLATTLYTTDELRLVYPVRISIMNDGNATRIPQQPTSNPFRMPPSPTNYASTTARAASTVSTSPSDSLPRRRFWWRGARDENLEHLNGVSVENRVQQLVEYINTRYPKSKHGAGPSALLRDDSDEPSPHDSLIIAREYGAPRSSGTRE
ncbi:hypothetical protein K474DRAFT_1713026 [Panus rudis PR-1116 ss-1]|nr:hypothetical protein K474DRAFT_1713026 [Panus rudis PR-1116 ss-1]